MNNKGLSSIIATVLIVLLALAAVAIVWTVINGMLTDVSGEVSLTNLCVQSEAKPTNCVYTADDEVSITMQLVRGDNVVELVGIAELDDGNRVNGKVSAPPKLGTNTTTIELIEGQTPLIAKATVIVKDESGNTKTCDEYTTQVQCNPAV